MRETNPPLVWLSILVEGTNLVYWLVAHGCAISWEPTLIWLHGCLAAWLLLPCLWSSTYIGTRGLGVDRRLTLMLQYRPIAAQERAADTPQQRERQLGQRELGGGDRQGQGAGSDVIGGLRRQ
jgi:hypothetical protein